MLFGEKIYIKFPVRGGTVRSVNIRENSGGTVYIISKGAQSASLAVFN
jgi:hypothetical protein